MSNIRAGHFRRARAAVALLTRGALLAAGATVASGCSSPARSVAQSGSAGQDSGGCIDCFTLDEPDGGVLLGSSSNPGIPNESALTPAFSTVVTPSVPPPPISGGTLLVTSDGTHAVAADPDRDSVYVVDLHAQTVAFTISLHPGDEPGRLVEDGAGRVHVALRSGGALVTIDPTTGSILDRRSVCPAPRGVAWDSSTDLVWVACATGEVVALPSAGGAATTSFTVERDLRDVIVSNGSFAISEFRSAEVLRLAGDGTITRRDALPSPTTGFVPHVAWRAVPGPSGTIVTLHQAESTASLVTTVQGGYGCGGGGFGQTDVSGTFDAGSPLSLGTGGDAGISDGGFTACPLSGQGQGSNVGMPVFVQDAPVPSPPPFLPRRRPFPVVVAREASRAPSWVC